MRYELTVFGQPVGKGRPRFTRYGQPYTPDKTKDYEELVQYTFKSSYPNAIPLEDALRVMVIAYFTIPTSYSKKKRQACLNDEIPVTKRPDIDNVAKIVLDGLNKYAYKDDAQIIELGIKKMWSDMPRVEVYIEEV
jgi:Holliday junction resolvase RusA-like endonuclease